MSHATNALLIHCQDFCHQFALPTFASQRAQVDGNAFRKGSIGRESTSNGAATSIKISCCVMCTENNTRPHGCNGETRATNNANHPPTKHPTSHFFTARPVPSW